MRIFAVIYGIALIVLVAQDAFETIVLPRRVTRRIRLARIFYRLSQIGWKSIGHLIRSRARWESLPIKGVNRLSSTEFTRLQDMLTTAGIRLREGAAFEQKLAELRATYEPFVNALADRIQVSLPPWIPPADALDDWQTSAWDDLFPSIRQTLNQVMHPQ